MARLMNSVIGAFVNPKRVIEIDENRLHYLNAKHAHILFAAAEAVVGEDIKRVAPDFIYIVEDYLGYQRQESRDALAQGLVITETGIVSLFLAGNLRGFSYLSLAERRAVLAKLAASNVQLLRNLYAAYVNIAASIYYSREATWAMIGYDGVSVDDPRILAAPRWRPGDARPVER